jgi:hypothetical protein
MRYTILLLIFMLSTAVYAGELDYEAGRAAIKVRPQYKASLRPSGSSTGISSLDQHLARLGVRSVKPRFKTSGKHSSPVDLSLILEISFPPKSDPIGICNSLSRNEAILWAEPIWFLPHLGRTGRPLLSPHGLSGCDADRCRVEHP